MTKILGNDALMKSLKRIADAGHVSHGYILCGAAGSGRKTIAQAFAEMLHTSPADIILTEHEKPNLISVDDVRTQINSSVHIRPYESAHKIYIVDEAEKMNVQAQNALLKTIEEPPEYVIIILVTANADAFLDTILSRCVLLNVRPLPEIMVMDALAKRGYEGETAAQAARLSGGSIGRAEELVSSENFSDMLKLVLDMLQNAARLDTRGMMDFVSEIQKYKADGQEVLDYIRLWFRDVLLYKTGAGEEALTFSSGISAIRYQTVHMSYSGINEVLERIEEAKTRLQANVNPELTFELTVMAIRDALNERK